MQDENKPIILIIPDVHGRAFWRKAVESYPDLPTVFLGDYLDPYTHYDGILPTEAFVEFKEILKFKSQNKKRVTLLLGNHDIHYLGAKLNSSRKDWMNQEKIENIFVKKLSLFELTKLVRVGDRQYLFSHAGIIPEWMEWHFEGIDLNDTEHVSEILNDKLNEVDTFRQFVSSALMDRSASRWGYARYPSVVWADVEDHQYQQRRLPNVYQIFGHNQQEFGPVITEQYANLDCRKAFLLMEDGEIIVV